MEGSDGSYPRTDWMSCNPVHLRTQSMLPRNAHDMTVASSHTLSSSIGRTVDAIPVSNIIWTPNVNHKWDTTVEEHSRGLHRLPVNVVVVLVVVVCTKGVLLPPLTRRSCFFQCKYHASSLPMFVYTAITCS